jgi:hypothetical protein
MVFVCTVIDRRHPEESITHASSRGQHWTPDTDRLATPINNFRLRFVLATMF